MRYVESGRWSRSVLVMLIPAVSLAVSAIAIPIPALALTISASASGSTEPAQVAFPPPPASVVNGDFLIEPNAACMGSATTCGFTGDGINEQTTWTFDFRSDPDYASFASSGALTSAELTLTLTVRQVQVTTDGEQILGLGEITEQIHELMVGETATVTFNLLDFYTSSEILGILDSTLIGGTIPKNAGELLMLYQDDAIVSNASISLTTIPEPSLAVLILGGLALLSAQRSHHRER